MKIKPEYTVCFEEAEMYIVRRLPDGTHEYLAPLSASAAVAWAGFEYGLSREAIIDSVVNEFEGADRDTVAEELDALARQLVALGYAEE